MKNLKKFNEVDSINESDEKFKNAQRELLAKLQDFYESYEKYAWFVPCHSTKISQNLKQLKEMQTRIGAWFPGDFWKY